MKRYILSLIIVVSSIHWCSAQIVLDPATVPVQLPQSLPTEPMAMEVYGSDQTITFKTGEDFAGSKSIPNYYRIHIKSSQGPWIVTARLVDQYSESGYMPISEDYTSLVSLRDQSSGHMIRLSNVPQTLIFCNNSLPDNDYFVDLIVDPPFNVPTSTHRGIVSFQLTNQ